MALRRFVALLRASALARRAMAAAAAAGVRGKQGRACAMARVQGLRAEAEASSRAIASCASARARDAQAMVLRCQRQAGAAAAVAAFRFRFAHDRMFSFLLRVGYGETAPKTPSPMEVLEYLLKLMGRAQRIHKIWENINHIIEWFEKLDPLLLAMLVSYIGPMLDYFAELIQIVENLVSTAPECLCPFLGIRGLPFEEFPVDEGLIGVISVAGKFAGMLLLIVSGLCICLIIDVIEVFSSASLTAKRIIEEAFTHSSFDCKILSKVIEYCSQTDKTRKAAAVPDAGSKFELNTFHRDFLKVNQSKLFDLILTANYLDIKELLDLTCQSVVADMIKGKTPEEIRMTFNIKKDLTPEDLRKKELLDLTCQMVAAMIRSKTPEEIRKTFNIKTDFIKEDDLDIQEVLDLTSQTVADMIKGKTPDEIREIFFTKGGCTPEEEEAVRKENRWAFK